MLSNENIFVGSNARITLINLLKSMMKIFYVSYFCVYLYKESHSLVTYLDLDLLEPLDLSYPRYLPGVDFLGFDLLAIWTEIS